MEAPRTLFLVFGSVMILVAGCSDGSRAATDASPPEVAAEGSAPEAQFDFARGSLCDWITAEEMNQIVADAQARAGTTWPFAAFEADDCITTPGSWTGPALEWSPWVWATFRTPPTPARGGLAVGLVPVDWVPTAWGNWSRGEPAENFIGHEMLDESVTYGGLRCWSDWLENMRVDLLVRGHGDDVLRFTIRHSNPGTAVTDGMSDAPEALGLAVADAMLEAMHWVD